MILVLASDDKYVQHCAVVISSILENNENVTFYLLTEGISTDNKLRLEEIVNKYKATLHVVNVPTDIIEKCPMPSHMSNHISRATYYRLLVADLLPERVERILYLDCDIVVRKSLLPLWNTPMDEKAIAAVYQYNEWADATNSWERLNIPRQFGYFNAGVLLINLKYWREHQVQSRLFFYITENFGKIHSHDQDTLNAVLYNEAQPLSITWNLLSFFFDDYSKWSFPAEIAKDEIEKIKSNPAVVHYVYKPKPWEFACSHIYKNEYYKYLELTPWKGFIPPFLFKDYWIFIIKPKIVQCAINILKTVGIKK